MSEEEIISYVEQLLELNYVQGQPYQAIKDLLDLYKQEKEKNKELEEKAKTTIAVIVANYIHKDKIKEKLDKKREEIKENCLVYGLSPDKAIYKKNVQIAMVDTIKKELLEERN